MLGIARSPEIRAKSTLGWVSRVLSSCCPRAQEPQALRSCARWKELFMPIHEHPPGNWSRAPDLSKESVWVSWQFHDMRDRAGVL